MKALEWAVMILSFSVLIAAILNYQQSVDIRKLKKLHNVK